MNPLAPVTKRLVSLKNVCISLPNRFVTTCHRSFFISPIIDINLTSIIYTQIRREYQRLEF